MTKHDGLMEAADKTPDRNELSDLEIAQRIASGDRASFEVVMRQCNRQLFRVARAILKDDSEAEEALQEAYITAYVQISAFRGASKLSTWITRIVINESLGRMRKQQRRNVVIPFSEHHEDWHAKENTLADDKNPSPEDATLRAEIRALLEQKIDALPIAFRTVFMMRELEEMTVEETADCLGIPAATVRTRLFRARALLREALAREIDIATPDAFAFAGTRCDRIVSTVLNRLTAGDADS
ncbi:MAG: putative polymerase sigma factor [Betaproteobacteria bacterium]|jgi:RNA polymerase sigma-70 factor, ECF subfamily|nr:putative polymerase sigma factor [Betaproteobacteria bacterium]